jgi:signal transduction histidine kinase
MFEEQHVVLRIDDQLPADLVVSADATRIGHVFSNLLANALRYTPSGGEVRIAAERESDSTADAIEIRVSDTGSGIPRQYLSRVFEKFFRVPSQSGGGGAGLGLAIVKDIIEAHGGRISIDSEEGRGTTVRFTLRLASVPTPSLPEEPATVSASS